VKAAQNQQGGALPGHARTSYGLMACPSARRTDRATARLIHYLTLKKLRTFFGSEKYSFLI
jgi:hypothetical protein